MEVALEEDFLFTEVVKNTSNAVIVTDLERKIVFVNKAFTDITGYTSQEVQGRSPSMLQGPETNERTLQRIKMKLESFERVNETVLNYTKSGEKYWIDLDIYPFLDDLGKPKHYMAIQNVVTEMKSKEILVKEQAKRIKENISYAKTLQNSLFRDTERQLGMFSDLFILDNPKDEVGGDFYILEEYQNQSVVLVGDCTGHGVSGAIMTALCISVTTELLTRYKTLSPSMVLNKANEKIAQLIKDSSTHVNDGMEATLLFIDKSRKTIRYATSKQQDIYLSNGDDHLNVFKSVRQKVEHLQSYELLDGQIEYQSGQMLYLSSDGLKDQIGGDRNKRLGSKKFVEILESMMNTEVGEQENLIRSSIAQWKGLANEQTDDILMIGIRLE